MTTTFCTLLGFAALLSTTAACSTTQAQPLSATNTVSAHRAAVECDGGAVRAAHDADKFYACEVIAGDLTIERTELPDLAAFANVRSVTGTLTIAHNRSLESLSKLRRLRSAKSVVIEGNPKLADARGLEGLVTLERLVLRDNGLYRTNGLENLKSVGSLAVTHNKALLSLAGLNGLKRAASVELSDNPRLCAKLGLLPNLAHVPGTFVVRHNVGVTEADVAELAEHAQPRTATGANIDG